jgi:hypothetical protein
MTESTQKTLAKLAEIVPPPASPAETGSPLQRDLVQKGLKTRLPEGVYAFAKMYGSGTFETSDSSVVLNILNPFSKMYFKQLNNLAKVTRDLKNSEGESYCPFLIYPQKRGLFPCGSGEERRILFWLRQSATSKWPLVLFTPEQRIVRCDCTLPIFLHRLFSGQFDKFGGSWNAKWFVKQRGRMRFVAHHSPDIEDTQRLHLAASAGWQDKIQDLLRAGADPNQVDFEGRTPLFDAIERGDATSVRLLLQAGAKPNVVDAAQTTPLHETIRMFVDNKITRLLLEYGAEIDALDRFGYTPLMRAVLYDNKEAASLLLKHGANSDIKAPNGDSAISLSNNNRVMRSILRSNRRG